MVTEIIPSSSKITDRKLNGKIIYGGKKIIRRYLVSLDMEHHLIDNPPQSLDKETHKKWMKKDDDKLFNQIQNTLEDASYDIIFHCETVKELWEHLEFLYASKKNLIHTYDVLQSQYRADQQERTLVQYLTYFKRVYEEVKMLLPITSDVKEMELQREQMAVMCFLAGLREISQKLKFELIYF